jgi:hypothetical protein
MSTTANYGWAKPTVAADADTWGTKINTALDDIDVDLAAVSVVASAALPKAGGTLTGGLIGTTAAFSGAVSSAAFSATTGAFSGLVTLSAGANNTPAAAPSTTAVGYLGQPVVAETASRTLAMTDCGKTLYNTGAGGSVVYTVPPNSSVAFPIGTVIEFEGPTVGSTYTVTNGVGVTINHVSQTAGGGIAPPLNVLGFHTYRLKKIDTDLWRWIWLSAGQGAFTLGS